MTTPHRITIEHAYGDGTPGSGDWAPIALLEAAKKCYPNLAWLNMTKEFDVIALHGYVANKALSGFVLIKVEAWSGDQGLEKGSLQGSIQIKGDMEAGFSLDLPFPVEPGLRLDPFMNGLHAASVGYIKSERQAATRLAKSIEAVRLEWLGVKPV